MITTYKLIDVHLNNLKKNKNHIFYLDLFIYKRVLQRNKLL